MILPLPALVMCVPYFFLGSLTPLSSLSCSLSLCHTVALSFSRVRSLYHSVPRPLSLLPLHTDRAAKGARPRLRAEQTASSFPSPAGRRVLSRGSRHRPVGCSVSTTWANAWKRKGGLEARGGMAIARAVDSPYWPHEELQPVSLCILQHFLLTNQVD